MTVWGNAYLLERIGADPIVVRTVDSVATVLQRPWLLAVGRVGELTTRSRYYVVLAATLRPFSAEDLEEVGWLSGGEGGGNSGFGVVTEIPRTIFDTVRNVAGFGDQKARAISAVFGLRDLFEARASRAARLDGDRFHRRTSTSKTWAPHAGMSRYRPDAARSFPDRSYASDPIRSVRRKTRSSRSPRSILASIPVGVLFVVSGMEVNLRAAEGSIIFLAILLVCVVGAKLIGSWIATPKGYPSLCERTLIMFGGLGQGEMGILIAAYLFSRGLLTPFSFNVSIIVVVILTMLTPIAMRVVLSLNSILNCMSRPH